MNVEQLITLVAIFTAVGASIGSGFAAFFNNRKFAPIKAQAAAAHSTAGTAAKHLEDMKTKYDKLDREFDKFRLDAEYQRGVHETEIKHLKELISKQDKEIDALKKQRDDLMRLLITERAKIAALNTRITNLEIERDQLKRDLDIERRKSQSFLTPKLEVTPA